MLTNIGGGGGGQPDQAVLRQLSVKNIQALQACVYLCWTWRCGRLSAHHWAVCRPSERNTIGCTLISSLCICRHTHTHTHTQLACSARFSDRIQEACMCLQHSVLVEKPVSRHIMRVCWAPSPSAPPLRRTESIWPRFTRDTTRVTMPHAHDHLPRLTTFHDLLIA